MRPRAISNVAILAILALVVASLLLALFIIRPIAVGSAHARERLVRLLCETDYRALLGDCRELEARVRRGDLKGGTHGVRVNPSPEAASFPHGILSIQPCYVLIMNDGRVILELQGIPSYGVVAYPEDVDHYVQGDVELIPGLWYYDENYDMYADHKKAIDALVEKGKRRNASTE